MARGRPQKTTRLQWLQAAGEMLAENGVEALSVEALARRLGVTKGGFYGHFDDRRELLDAVVAYWEEVGTEAIIAAVEAGGGDVTARSNALWALATKDSMGPELAIRDWARRDEAARTVVERVDDRRLGYLRALYSELGFRGADCEARCLLVYSLLIGDHFIAANHRGCSRQEVLAQCLLLLRGGEAAS